MYGVNNCTHTHTKYLCKESDKVKHEFSFINRTNLCKLMPLPFVLKRPKTLLKNLAKIYLAVLIFNKQPCVISACVECPRKHFVNKQIQRCTLHFRLYMTNIVLERTFTFAFT